MFHRVIAAVVVVLSTLLTGCAGPLVSFSPYSSVDAPPPQVTQQAIEIRPGDRQYLNKASPKVLGWVSSESEPGDPAIVEAARTEAAKRGGTHVLFRGAKTDVTIDAMPLVVGLQVDESQRATYVVLRVAPENWGLLPDVLQPKPLQGPGQK